MEKIKIIAALSVLLLCQGAEAQITQLEIASGLAKTNFNSFSIRPIDENRAFSIATLAFFQKYHRSKNKLFDETGVQSTAFWNFSKAVSIGPSLYFNSVSGFSERISLLYALKKSDLVFTAIPSVSHSEQTGFINGELFVQAQFTPLLKGHWKLLASVQLLTHWDKFSIHTRSFQLLRLGFSYHNTQFGLAIDFDQYGEAPTKKTSIGLFVRKIFLDNNPNTI